MKRTDRTEKRSNLQAYLLGVCIGIFVEFLLLIACVVLVYVTRDGDAETAAESETAEQEIVYTEKVIYTYQLVRKDAAYVSDEVKLSWREPLLGLLRSDRLLAGEGEDMMGCLRYMDDDGEPRIIYYLGLFDINIDGTPELLVGLGGGSKGNCYYAVLDMATGEKIDGFEGDHDDSLCIYFNETTGQYETIGEFWFQKGVMNPFVYINKMTILPPSDTADRVQEENLFYVNYEIQLDGNCKTAQYMVNGEPTVFEQYYRARNQFDDEHVRRYETGLTLITQYDYATPEALVDALLATGQEFVVPLEEN